MAENWREIGLILAGVLTYATILAVITRFFSKWLEGQTFGLVVAGVAGVAALSGFIIGWSNVVILAACFAVAAVPMGVEYYGRVISQNKAAREAGMEQLEK